AATENGAPEVEELDEDFAPESMATQTATGTMATQASADSADEESFHAAMATEQDAEGAASHLPTDQEPAAAEPRSRPFAQLAELPSDLGEAFEAFKLAIVRHRMAFWQEVAQDDVLAALDALRELTLAPAD